MENIPEETYNWCYRTSSTALPAQNCLACFVDSCRYSTRTITLVVKKEELYFFLLDQYAFYMLLRCL